MALFLLAIVPVITDQVTRITDNAPAWLDQLQRNQQVQELDEQFDVIDKVREYVQDGNFAQSIFGGVLGLGLRVLGALANGFLIIVLTLYFLSSLDATKRRALPSGPGLATRAGHQARRPGGRERRRLRRRGLRRRGVRRHHAR